MNVSEFEDIGDATESLISMMQAYDVQAKDSMEIIDKLNNIGKFVAALYSNVYRKSSYNG